MADHFVKSTPRHEELRLAILEAMKPFDDIPPIEQLAILAALTGQYLAMQDSTRYTSEAVSRLVMRNIELGNAQAITAVAMGVINPKGKA